MNRYPFLCLLGIWTVIIIPFQFFLSSLKISWFISILLINSFILNLIIGLLLLSLSSFLFGIYSKYYLKNSKLKMLAVLLFPIINLIIFIFINKYTCFPERACHPGTGSIENWSVGFALFEVFISAIIDILVIFLGMMFYTLYEKFNNSYA